MQHSEHQLEVVATDLAIYLAKTSYAHYPFYWAPISYWLEPLSPHESAALHRDVFKLWHTGYQDDFTQRTSEMAFGVNDFLYANPGAALLSLRCADVPSAIESATVWEEHAVKAQQSKSHHITWEYATVYPQMCQICDFDRCSRMFNVVGMTWQSAASMNLAPQGYQWNTEASCGNQEVTVCLYAKLMCVLSSPSSVEKVEILSALPGPDSGTDAFRERAIGAAWFIVPSCRTMVADMARELGRFDEVQTRIARFGFMFHKSHISQAT